jgi:hypothetical protein
VALLVDEVVGWYVASYLLCLLLYGGALGLIAWLDLLPQRELFRQNAAGPRERRAWLVPCLAGAPLALAAFLYFVAAPVTVALTPPEPREVCQSFIDAKDAKGKASYTTNNLHDALDTLARLESMDGASTELTGEGPANPDVGGYYVGFRITYKAKPLEGAYLLVQRDGKWKIEEVYLTAFNGRPIDPPAPLSVVYPELKEATDLASRSDKGGSGKQLTPADKKAKRPSSPSWPKNVGGAAFLVLLVCGLLARLSRHWQKWFGGKQAST